MDGPVPGDPPLLVAKPPAYLHLPVQRDDLIPSVPLVPLGPANTQAPEEGQQMTNRLTELPAVVAARPVSAKRPSSAVFREEEPQNMHLSLPEQVLPEILFLIILSRFPSLSSPSTRLPFRSRLLLFLTS